MGRVEVTEKILQLRNWINFVSFANAANVVNTLLCETRGWNSGINSPNPE